MTDENKRCTRLVSQVGEQLDYVGADDAVQSRCHLVAEQNFRIGGQRSCHIDSLLLPSGQFHRIATGEFWRKFNHLQYFRNFGAFFLAFDSAVKLKRAPQYLTYGLFRIKRGIRHLKYELNFLQLFTLPIVQTALQLFVFKFDLTAGLGQYPSHHASQRGFSTTRFADNTDHMSVVNFH